LTVISNKLLEMIEGARELIEAIGEDGFNFRDIEFIQATNSRASESIIAGTKWGVRVVWLRETRTRQGPIGLDEFVLFLFGFHETRLARVTRREAMEEPPKAGGTRRG
jgi:hypothetical protein